MSEDRRSKGMYHSLIGKPSLRVVLFMGLLMGLSVLLLAACGGEESAKDGAGQDHKKKEIGSLRVENASGDSARCGQRCTLNSGRIAFGRHPEYGQPHSAIFAMNLDGSHVSQITHPPEGFRDDFPEWSADGQRLAFVRQSIEDAHIVGSYTSGMKWKPVMSLGDESMSRIMVLNTKTGDARQVVGVEGFDPAFSPDGHSLAFKRILGPDTDAKRIEGIWIVGLDGSTLHQVTNVDPKLPAAFSDSSPQFSPDGKMLVFERTRLEDDRHAVFVQRIDSSGSPEDAHQLTPWKMDCGITPEFSPDGKLVLFRCGEWLEAPSMLWWVHPDGTGLHRLEDETVIEPCCSPAPQVPSYLGSGFSPSFSGGEGWITTSWVPPLYDLGPADVAVMRIEDGEVVRTTNLTKSEMDESAPVWGTHPLLARR
jgi:Tol biopolymer transport system component